MTKPSFFSIAPLLLIVLSALVCGVLLGISLATDLDGSRLRAVTLPPVLRRRAQVSQLSQPTFRAAHPHRRSPLALVFEEVALTGAPPLASRSDARADAAFVPDFEGRGVSLLLLPPLPRFYAAASLGAQPSSLDPHSPLGYARATEDAIRDVALAIFASPGREWSEAAVEAMREFAHEPPPSGLEHARLCRVGPVTAPFWCLASLRSARPNHFKASGGDQHLLFVDVGATLAGYFGLLAATSAAGEAGLKALVIDPQPACAEWAASAGRASGLQASQFEVLNTIVVGPEWLAGRKAVAVGSRSDGACVGTTTQAAFFDRETEVSELQAYNESVVHVPAQTLDVIIASALSRETKRSFPSAVIMLLKIDAAGREADVLAGATELLDGGRILNLIVEFNKQRLAAFMGLPSALAARSRFYKRQDAHPDPLFGADAAPESWVGESRGLALSDADNSAVSQKIAALVRSLLARGFECLCADRGWWSAQAPFRPGSEAASDGATLEEWALKLSRVSEVDVWCYLAADARGVKLLKWW